MVFNEFMVDSSSWNTKGVPKEQRGSTINFRILASKYTNFGESSLKSSEMNPGV